MTLPELLSQQGIAAVIQDGTLTVSSDHSSDADLLKIIKNSTDAKFPLDAASDCTSDPKCIGSTSTPPSFSFLPVVGYGQFTFQLGALAPRIYLVANNLLQCLSNAAAQTVNDINSAAQTIASDAIGGLVGSAITNPSLQAAMPGLVSQAGAVVSGQLSAWSFYDYVMAAVDVQIAIDIFAPVGLGIAAAGGISYTLAARKCFG